MREQKSSGGAAGVLRTAILSRLLLVSLICSWRSLFPPYDTSASLNPPCLSPSRLPPPPPPLLPRLASALDRSVVWDAVYFVRIAECGYEYEQTYAFFPALPIAMRLIARTVLASLIPLIGYRPVLVLSGYVINNAAFVAAAVFLYRLSLLVLKDEGAAIRASTLFCFNPASIFYSSIYSESLYALFAFGGLYYLFVGSSTIAMLLFALSGSARSNGMLNAGYLCFQMMCKAYGHLTRENRPALAMREVLAGVMRSICVVLPLISFQAYGYFKICSNRELDELRPWCKTRIPRLYDYIQGHYWGVGFMRYFQVKQLPNFLLATPILYVSLCSIVTYAKTRPDVVFSLGLQASPEDTILAKGSYGTRQEADANSESKRAISSKSPLGALVYSIDGFSRLKQRKHQAEPIELSKLDGQDRIVQAPQGYFSSLLLPFIYHLTFLALTAFFIMHVQVATRFLSSSPPIYWFAAYLFASSDRRSTYLIWAYSSAYILLGSLLFSNFYPFT